MSFSYYRRSESQPPAQSYGFKQVTSKELAEIMQRVCKSTYTRKVNCEEQRHVNNYTLLDESGRRRCVSACDRIKAPIKQSNGDTAEEKQRRLTDRDMTRLLRRLQRPTETFLNATSGKVYDDVADNFKQGKVVRAKSADPRPPRVVAKYRRPTTASMAKTLDTCHLCFEHENKKSKEPDVFDFDYSDPRTVPEEEMDFIIERVNKPTSASSRGLMTCYRTPISLDEVKIRANLPLLSGLSRSKSVKEITERLSRKRHGHLPQSTPITSY